VRRAALAFLLIVLALVPTWLLAEDLRIASFNMQRLGEDRKDYTMVAGVVGHFDVVAAEEVMNEEGMQNVLRHLGPTWSKAMSEESEGSKAYREYYGFFYDERVELVKKLGPYPGKDTFFRPPYGAEFRVKGSGFTFTLVACHIVYGNGEKVRRDEIHHLGEVYRYFEGLTGRKGTTIIAGDFNEEEQDTAFASLLALDDRDVLPPGATTVGAHGPSHDYDHIFLPPPLRSRTVAAGIEDDAKDPAGYAIYRDKVSDHLPVYLILRTDN
jgi:deoxyribonuclease-1-like protein